MVIKLFSIWWLRILSFAFLTILFMFLFNNFNIPTYINESFHINFFLSLLVASLIIDFFRAGNYFILFGLFPTKFSILEICFPVLSNFIFFNIILVLILLSNDSVIKANDNFYYNYLLNIAIYILIWATIEELIFRGIIFQSLLDRFGFFFSSFSISLVFTVIHYFNPHSNYLAIFNTFLASLLMCFMYYRTKSLYLPIFFHFSWNLFSMIIINSNVSGYKFSIGIFDIPYHNLNPIFFGGNYGIEAGLFSTIYFIILIYFTIKFFRIHPNIQSKLFHREIMES